MRQASHKHDLRQPLNPHDHLAGDCDEDRSRRTAFLWIFCCCFLLIPIIVGSVILGVHNSQKNRADTLAPSASPTTSTPTAAPSTVPTIVPLSAVPTEIPTDSPTSGPTAIPTTGPSVAPSASPTSAPTVAPSVSPTAGPSDAPTTQPSALPTLAPSSVPTEFPTSLPTASPTDAPTLVPSLVPTALPTTVPTTSPTQAPETSAPTMNPVMGSTSPTNAPSDIPTTAPSDAPTAAPTDVPTTAPSGAPSFAPTTMPSVAPTEAPSNAPTTPAPTPFGATDYIFITSTSMDGSFGGLASADTICNELGANSTLPHIAAIPGWVALLSDGSTSADDRIPEGRWKNTNEDLVAIDNANLFDGSLDASISFDENGNAVPDNTVMWTGSFADGFSYFVLTYPRCGNWTNTVGNTPRGLSGATDGNWLFGIPGDSTCANPDGRLYCVADTGKTATPSISPTASPTFSPSIAPTAGPSMSPTAAPSEAPTAVPSVSPTVFGAVDYIFVTSTQFQADFGGLVGGDTICNNLAGSSILPQIQAISNWIALLSVIGTNAADRIPEGVWKNTNEDVVAIDNANLFDGSLDNPIAYDESGVLISPARPMWSGSFANGFLRPVTPCGNWTVTTGTTIVGVTGEVDDDWLFDSTMSISCSTIASIYCVANNGKTAAPTTSPTLAPSTVPSLSPTIAPTTGTPTVVPSLAPTALPSVAPTAVPTASPTLVPSIQPTPSPTLAPTTSPTPLSGARYIFVTSALYNASFGGLVGADAICNDLASASALSHIAAIPSWVSLLSDISNDAFARIPQGPWKTTTEVIVATSNADLFDGTIAYPVAFDESGELVILGRFVRTGSFANGGRYPLIQCGNWTTTAGSSVVGWVGAVDDDWLFDSTGNAACSEELPLYCVAETGGTFVPTGAPTTAAPTTAPSSVPTVSPTHNPTVLPSASPTVAPTAQPTSLPTSAPTVIPSVAPTVAPSLAPTQVPSNVPTAVPTTATPTVAPSPGTSAPTTATPTFTPSNAPTAIPTVAPSAIPTVAPTVEPTAQPSAAPSAQPTGQPTVAPTAAPTAQPSNVPSAAPTTQPTATPTAVPTDPPTICPSGFPVYTGPEPAMRVFITRNLFKGDVGGYGVGVDGADMMCQDQASKAGHSGVFRAWLSPRLNDFTIQVDYNGQPSIRFDKALDKPYVLVDGTVIANNWADLTDGTLVFGTSLNLDECGEPPVGSIHYCSQLYQSAFTNTNPDGTAYPDYLAWDCDNYTSPIGTPSTKTVHGSSATWGPFWSRSCEGIFSNCDQFMHYYCFQQDV